MASDDGVVVHLLGPVAVRWRGRPVPLGGPNLRGVMAVLALRRGTVTSARELVDSVWEYSAYGDPFRSLSTAVSELRHALVAHGVPAAEATITGDRRSGYSLHGAACDVERFDSLMTRAREANVDPAVALALSTEAVEWCVGEPLADVAGLPFAEIAAAALTRRVDEAFDDWAELAVAVDPVRHRSRLLDLAAVRGHRPRIRRAVEVAERSVGRLPSAIALRTPSGFVPAPDPAVLDVPEAPAPGAEAPIGRAAEWATIVGLAVSSREASAHVDVVAAGGLGKSTLLAAVAASLRGRGMTVVEARWRHSGVLDIAGSDPGNPAELDARQRLLAAVPVGAGHAAVIVDDAHLAGDALDGMLAAFGSVGRLRCLMVTARRPGPPPGSISGMERTTIELAPLDLAAGRALANDIAGRDDAEAFDPAEIDRLVATAEGNPLLLISAVSARSSGRSSGWLGGLAGLFPAPGTIPRRLLEVLALTGEDLDALAAASVLDTPIAVAVAAIEELLAASLVRSIDARFASVAVRHDLITEAALAASGPIDGEVARRLAAVLEQRGRLAAAYRALYPLGPAGADERRRVGRDALRSHVDLGEYVAAMRLAEELTAEWSEGEPERDAIEAERIAARGALGDGVHVADELLARAQRCTAAGRWADAARIMLLRTRFGQAYTRDHAAIEVLRAVIAAAPADDHRAQLDLATSWFQQLEFSAASPAKMAEACDHAEAMAAALGRPSARVSAQRIRHRVLEYQAAPLGRLNRCTAAAMIDAEATGLPEDLAGAWGLQLVDALHAHDLDLARICLARSAAMALPQAKWLAKLGHAALSMTSGELGAARAQIGDAWRFAQRHGVRSAFEAFLTQRFQLAWIEGTLTSTAADIVRVPWDAPGRIVWGAARALVQSVTDPATARETCSAVAARLGEEGIASWNGPLTAAVLIEAAFAAEEPEAIEVAAGLLAPFHGRRVLLGMLCVDYGPVDRYLALADVSAGRVSQALRRLDDIDPADAGALWAARIERDRARITGSELRASIWGSG